jgi:hypothetical protein
MNIKRFKQGQKFRVVSGNTSFYATAKQIRNGIGDLSAFNAATQKCLDALEFTRSGKGVAEQCAAGLAGNWNGIVVQLDMA